MITAKISHHLGIIYNLKTADLISLQTRVKLS